MNIQKINWKLYIKGGGADLEPEAFFKVFNQWIPESPEIFVDVADYAHITGGPITLLAGFKADYVFDEKDGKRGLLYNYKQPLEGSNSDKLQVTLKSVLEACKKLEDAPEFEGKLSFSTSEITFILNDRALAENQQAPVEPIESEVTQLLENTWGDALKVTYPEDKRERYTLNVSFEGSPELSALIGKL
jgi:hypothetical protein